MSNEKEKNVMIKVNTKLEKARGDTIFPIPAQLRKDIRELKNSQIGSVKTRLKILKKEKLDLFISFQKNYVSKNEDRLSKKVDSMNRRFKDKFEKLRKIALELKVLKDEVKDSDYIYANGNTGLFYNVDYNSDYFSRYGYTFKVSNNIRKDELKDLFEKNYGKGFEEVSNKIEVLETTFEESLNFGDLDMVKSIYQQMKNAHKFLDKLEKMKFD